MTEKKINDCLKSGNLILAYVWHSVKGQICQTPNPDHAYMENLNNQAHWVIILSLNPAGEYVVFNPDSGALSHLIWIKSLDEQKPFLAGSEEDYIPTKHLEEISTAFKVEEKIKALQIEVDSTQVSYLVVNRIYPFENYSVAEKKSQNVDQPDAFYVSTLKTTKQAIQFIVKHEEFKPNLYDCPPGNASIGYRHLVHLGAVNGTHPAETEEFKKGITKERATFFLQGDVKEHGEYYVKSHVKVKLKQHQFDALVCLVFSIKPSLFISSTLLKHINNLNFVQKNIEEAFLLFNKGTVIDEKSKLPVENTLPELTKRRKNEAQLFNTGKYELEGDVSKDDHLFTKEQFSKMMPKATHLKIDLFYEPLEKAMKESSISTPLRIAHFMAQVGHECLDLLFLSEGMDGSTYEGRLDLGNTQTGDGKRFKGRGLIQLTGRSNYTSFQNYLRKKVAGYSLIDITTGDENPKQVATNPDLCVRSAIFYWTVLRPKLNIFADLDDIFHVSTEINGRPKKGCDPNGYQDRKNRLINCKKILGIN